MTTTAAAARLHPYEAKEQHEASPPYRSPKDEHDRQLSPKRSTEDEPRHLQRSASMRSSDDEREMRRSISAAEVETTTKTIPEIYGGPWVVLPDVRWMGRWDGATSAALLFTALFTPYEAAMLPTQVRRTDGTCWRQRQDGLV